MTITVLDSISTLLDCPRYSDLAELGAVEGYDESDLRELIERCARSTVVLSGKTALRREVMDYLPNIAFIGIFTQDRHLVEVDIAEALGIRCAIPAFPEPCRNLERLTDEIERFIGAQDG